jgi:hypothetical protein
MTQDVQSADVHRSLRLALELTLICQMADRLTRTVFDPAAPLSMLGETEVENVVNSQGNQEMIA